MYIYIILIILLLCTLYGYGVWINGFFERRGIKYIKPTLPYIGNIWGCVTMREHIFLILDKIYKSFPDESFVGYFEFLTPNIILRDLNLIKEIAMKEHESFPNHKVYIDDTSDPLFGNFLITLRDQKWKDMRTALTPAFTKNKLKGMFEFMTICAEQLVVHFEKEIDKTIENKKIDYLDIDICDYLKRYTSDVISTTAFGLESNSLDNPQNKMLQCGINAAHLDTTQVVTFLLQSSFPSIMKFLGVSIYDKKIINYFNMMVHSSIDYRIKNEVYRADMIQLLVEAKKKMAAQSMKNVNGNANGKPDLDNDKRMFTDYDITAQAVLFYIGGFESTSLISSALIYELALQPHLQKRLQDEIDHFIRSNERLTFDMFDDMKYLDMAVSEALRLWPTVACVDRECKMDYSIPGDYHNNGRYQLKKGDVVWIPIYSIQRDEKYFPDPNKFDPERFSDENKASFQSNAYMPFGIGPRRCIGIRYGMVVMKVAIFFLLSKFEFFATEKSMPIVVDPNSIVFQSKDGYWVGVRKRTQTTEWLKK